MAMSFVTFLQDVYERLQNATDKRVSDWLFVYSPVPTSTIVALYFIIVFHFGPQFMAERQPVKFGNVLPLYNFTQVVLNAFIFWKLYIASSNANYSYICTPLRSHSMDINEIKVASSIWWHFISKHFELIDTLIFVLRKQTQQITFLHVYHHATVPLLWWVSVKWSPSGQIFFVALFNSGIHVIMYTYYGLTALGPKIKKYLWWKKYLTAMQMIQFVCVISHTMISFYVECGFPLWLHWLALAHVTSLLFLFANFYYHAYLSTGNTKNITKPEEFCFDDDTWKKRN